MLHTKFQGHWSIGSGEEDFFRILSYMVMTAILVMWPRPLEQPFVPKGSGGCIWNLVTISPEVSGKKSFEIVDGWMNGRMDNRACLYYKLPRGLRLRWAKNCACKTQIMPPVPCASLHPCPTPTQDPPTCSTHNDKNIWNVSVENGKILSNLFIHLQKVTCTSSICF